MAQEKEGLEICNPALRVLFLCPRYLSSIPLVERMGPSAVIGYRKKEGD